MHDVAHLVQIICRLSNIYTYFESGMDLFIINETGNHFVPTHEMSIFADSVISASRYSEIFSFLLTNHMIIFKIKRSIFSYPC